jgi:DNA-binding PucR family transcriptional regulator
VAICARTKTGNRPDCDRLIAAHDPGALLAPLGRRWMVGVVALAGHERADEIAAGLQSHGMTVALSAPRRDPGSLHEAFREAQLLVDLEGAPDVQLAGQDETYRLLIGILLRDPDELVTLRERTISSLVDYDARHDTDLLETLKAFLDHDGSTTETADAMQLHRHTVGYRLSRVHGVSGLSPYESDGRERLSLGLKAHQILAAQRRLRAPGAPPPASIQD